MRSKDLRKQERAEILAKIQSAIEGNDAESFKQSFGEFAQLIQDDCLEEAKNLTASVDANILASRGVRQLTSEERGYYEKVIDAMKSANPKQALTGMTDVLPVTTINAVFDDLTQSHELLDAINFQNTSGLIEMIVNTDEGKTAAWGMLTAKITEELTSGFKKVKMDLNKLSAFIPVAKSMLDLGPEWLDRYVRTILSEALAYGLEKAIIDGTGKDQPIGMNRQVGDNVTTTGGVYPLKTAKVLHELTPAAYGELIAGIAKSPSGKARVVPEVLFIVSPVDYLKKVMPATTIRRADGEYVNDVFPYPTRLIQSVAVPEGKAIVGLARKYFMGVGTAKNGKIEYDDSYHFLEDERVYMIKTYAHGEPMDNNAFEYLDISSLAPAAYLVALADGYDARLSGLTIGSLTLSPAFNKSIFYYEATTTDASNKITVEAVSENATVEIKNGSTTVANKANATWASGENTLTIDVVDGPKAETYTVKVTKN